MKAELRLLLALALGWVPHLHATATVAPTIPPVVIDVPTPAPESEEAPTIRFSIPRYQPTLTERETVAACLVLEAANQGEYGLRSVMAVIRNRARGLPELFAFTVLRPKQFSALNQTTGGREPLWRTIQRAKRDRTWEQAMAIVDAAMDEAWHDPTGGATHYTRSGERTQWTRRLAKTVTIGDHSFYR